MRSAAPCGPSSFTLPMHDTSADVLQGSTADAPGRRRAYLPHMGWQASGYCRLRMPCTPTRVGQPPLPPAHPLVSAATLAQATLRRIRKAALAPMRLTAAAPRRWPTCSPPPKRPPPTERPQAAAPPRAASTTAKATVYSPITAVLIPHAVTPYSVNRYRSPQAVM